MVTTMEAHADTPTLVAKPALAVTRAASNADPGEAPPLKAESRNLSFHYGSFNALKNVSMPVYDRKVTARDIFADDFAMDQVSPSP